jgi:hypothetical protein
VFSQTFQTSGSHLNTLNTFQLNQQFVNPFFFRNITHRKFAQLNFQKARLFFTLSSPNNVTLAPFRTNEISESTHFNHLP